MSTGGAINDKKWFTALQASALLGKHIGMFSKPRLQEAIPLKDMSEDQLEEFIEAMVRVDPELNNLEIPGGDKQKKNLNETPSQTAHPPHPPPEIV